MTGALASAALGEDDWKRFWNMFGGAIVGRQAQDGAFAPPPGEDIRPDAAQDFREQGDRALATHTLVLLLPKGKLKFINKLKQRCLESGVVSPAPKAPVDKDL